MEADSQRDEKEVDLPSVRGCGQDQRSCFDCRHIKWQFGFPVCRIYNKPTSGAVNGCPDYSE